MATPVLERKRNATSHGSAGAGRPPGPSHTTLNRAVFYIPRFRRHLRRRLRSGMPLGAAWQSTRIRMREYRY